MNVRDFIISSYKIPKKDVFSKGKKCAEIALSKGYTKAQIIFALENIKVVRGFRNGILNFLRDH